MLPKCSGPLRCAAFCFYFIACNLFWTAQRPRSLFRDVSQQSFVIEQQAKRTLSSIGEFRSRRGQLQVAYSKGCIHTVCTYIHSYIPEKHTTYPPIAPRAARFVSHRQPASQPGSSITADRSSGSAASSHWRYPPPAPQFVYIYPRRP
ncbi:hypothetical protein L209DRAFT_215368 [Thermothelomyces heterothallicus CBS 203.75]